MTAAVRGLFGNWRGIALLALTAVFAIAAFAVPAMPQPLSYHAFADGRDVVGRSRISSTWNRTCRS